MRDKILDFESEAAYHRYLAYGYSHAPSGKVIPKGSTEKNVFEASPGHMGVRIKGHLVRRPSK